MTGAKMRVYEIAKEVGIPNKDLIAKIRALGLEVNNHMSSLDADDVARIRRSLEKEKQSVAQPQQTQRLATGGAVLRRRSSGDKPSDSASDERGTEAVRMRSHEVGHPPAPPAHAPQPPVIRRRTADDAAPPSAPVARPVVARPAEPAPSAPVSARSDGPRAAEARPVERPAERVEARAEPARPVERTEPERVERTDRSERAE